MGRLKDHLLHPPGSKYLLKRNLDLPNPHQTPSHRGTWSPIGPISPCAGPYLSAPHVHHIRIAHPTTKKYVTFSGTQTRQHRKLLSSSAGAESLKGLGIHRLSLAVAKPGEATGGAGSTSARSTTNDSGSLSSLHCSGFWPPIDHVGEAGC